jgi:multidrug resistance efflux pump
MVKKTINTLGCALLAPLAFAKTSTPVTEQKTTTQRTKITEPVSGAFSTTYEPGKIIVAGSESGHDTFSYVLDRRVRYVNKAGREIDEHLIKPGTRIDIHYDSAGETLVVVDDD